MSKKNKSLSKKAKGTSDCGFLTELEKDELFCHFIAKLELIKRAVNNVSAFLIVMILIGLVQIGLLLLK